MSGRTENLIIVGVAIAWSVVGWCWSWRAARRRLEGRVPGGRAFGSRWYE